MPGGKWRCLKYWIARARLSLAMVEQLDLAGRTGELARTFGIDFESVLTRGSQYRVESMLVRLAHTQNYLMLSPSREQVPTSARQLCTLTYHRHAAHAMQLAHASFCWSLDCMQGVPGSRITPAAPIPAAASASCHACVWAQLLHCWAMSYAKLYLQCAGRSCPCSLLAACPQLYAPKSRKRDPVPVWQPA